VTWWCVTLKEPWTWDPKAYLGIWISVLVLLVPYVVAMARRSGPNPHAARKVAFYVSGVLIYWAATDWPLGTLGAGYLASAHMVQFILYSLCAAPLLMLGTPEWMARRVLERLRAYRAVKWLSRPLIAGIGFNLILLCTHAPGTVDTFRSSQFGSFALDALWLVGGLLLWSPIISPLTELQARSYFVKMVYLFLAAQVVPTIPGGFLTFANFPLYSTYELAPRVWNISAGTDQAAAGVLMKLGGMPIIWGTMLVLMLKWARAEGHIDDPTRRKRAAASSGSVDAS
jgi:putative membrane protein